jgi:HPt (histidine-containing phosphotransfer) domain-containing protein
MTRCDSPVPLKAAPTASTVLNRMTDPVDRNVLSHHAAGDPVLQRDLLVLFATQADQIRSTVLASPQDLDALRAVAHLLAGSSRAVGASRLATAAAALEADLMREPAGAGSCAMLSTMIAALDEARDFAAELAKTLV